MLNRIVVRNYRALRYIDQRLGNVQVLIGPNASGKSTFLDVIAFVADMVSGISITEAVRQRAPNFRDITWMKQSDWLEFALEAEIPELQSKRNYNRLRYELRLGLGQNGELGLQAETLWLMRQSSDIPEEEVLPTLFPYLDHIPDRITSEPKQRTPPGWRKVLSKSEASNDYFRSETTEWNNMFRLGPQRPALANLPEDPDRFPVATWFKRYISEGVQKIMLNSEALRRPSAPQSPRTFLPDGSNLPWVIHELEEKYPERLDQWVGHVQTALPDIETIRTIERPEDKHRYLVIHYNSGLQAPSWVISDGTLRMLALTILAYIPELTGVYLIEEPENGIHPKAIETIYQSLTHLYSAQVFLATHSPVILSMATPNQLLCFDRTDDGETDIVLGSQHPALTDWRGKVDLGVLFAAGVLG
ncbi:MAG: AAA family ATPase [Anaerolineae bacterium]|jgi:predicted ATPase|nr:AAA family ATPase [Anaerolineae bacterium]